MTKVIEKEIQNFKPNIIFTHFINDLNIDHQYTSRAVLTAARPQTKNSVDEILFLKLTQHWLPNQFKWFAIYAKLFCRYFENREIKKKGTTDLGTWDEKISHSRSVKAVLNKNISIGNSID